MKVILNSRLIVPEFMDGVERLVQDKAGRPQRLLIAYRNDPAEETVLSIEAEDDGPEERDELPGMRRAMEEGVRAILDRNGVINSRNLLKTDGRIWVRSPHRRDALDGHGIRYSFGGNPVGALPDDEHPTSFPGNLICSGENDHGEISLRVDTDQPVQDDNGREVYHVDLDQASADSLTRDEAGDWTVRLPDRYRRGE